VLSSDPTVQQVGELLSMQLGVDQVLLTAKIKFRNGLNVEQIESVISRLKHRVQQQDSVHMQIFIEPSSLDQGKRKHNSASKRSSEAA
jgi:divalent metal cation (Fe/Co/Zn/Cd) transporter